MLNKRSLTSQTSACKQTGCTPLPAAGTPELGSPAQEYRHPDPNTTLAHAPKPEHSDQEEPQVALELKHISKSFVVKRGVLGQRGLLKAVSDASLTLYKGETLGLVGESGSGKSTLGRIAAGLLEPDSGAALLYGQRISSPGKQPIQMIFQDSFSALNPRRKIGWSVREPLDVAETGLSLARRKEKVNQMLELVGLTPEQARCYPHEFSGGQRQRVVVARALIRNPEIVICDEPVSSLDASIQAQVLNLLLDLKEKFALSYLFISHDLGVVGHMSDRVAVMYLGRIVELAETAELFANPAHPYTRALLASQPGQAWKLNQAAQAGQSESTSGRQAENQLKDNSQIDHDNAAAELIGDPPSPLNLPSGCALHPRCPFAMPICKKQRPELKQLAVKSHLTACHMNAFSQTPDQAI